MRLGWLLVSLSLLAGVVHADLIYLNQGEVISGTITQFDPTEIVILLADGGTRIIPTVDVFQATDDSGKLLFPLPNQEVKSAILNPTTPNQSITPSGPNEQILATENYRKVYHFPLWPILGGSVLLGYIGIDQLVKSSDTYDQSLDREAAGLEFNALRNQSLKQRTWGQISLAGACACLLIGIYPRIEKVPVQSALRVAPTQNGFQISWNY